MNIKTLKDLKDLRQRAYDQLHKLSFVNNMGVAKAEDGLFYINVDIDSTTSQADLSKLPESINSVKLRVRWIDSIHIDG